MLLVVDSCNTDTKFYTSRFVNCFITGKSTLLKAITKTGGETLSVREGEIALSPKLRLGYLEQKGVSGSTLSVREEVTSRMDSYSSAKIRLEAAELALSNGDTSDDALTSFEEAMSDFEAAGLSMLHIYSICFQMTLI